MTYQFGVPSQDSISVHEKWIMPLCHHLEENGVRVIGTAFLIAPGWAVTASHVLGDYNDVLAPPEVDISYAAVERTRIPVNTMIFLSDYDGLCHYVKSVYPTNSDISILELVTSVGQGRELYELDLQPPSPGVGLWAAGYPHLSHEDASGFNRELRLFASNGYVLRAHPAHHSVLHPYPILEAHMELRGSMSGGPVINLATDRIIGIITSSYPPDEHGREFSFLSLMTPIMWLPDIILKLNSLHWCPHGIDYYKKSSKRLEYIGPDPDNIAHLLKWSR